MDFAAHARILLAMLASLITLVALSASIGLAPQTAWANRVIETPKTSDGTAMTVSDDITRVHVSKYNAETHEPLLGAKFAIIRSDTGEVVDEWVTDGTAHELEKFLDVNVVYILREVEAPAGYTAVADTVFVVDEMEGAGITIINKDDSTELTEAYKLALYDPPVQKENEVVKTETRPGSKKVVQKPIPSSLAKTGDSLSVVHIATVCALAILALAIALVAWRRMRRTETPRGRHSS